MVGPKSLGLWQGYDLAKCKGAFHTLLAMDDALGSVEISRGDEKLQRLHDGWAPLSRVFLEDQTQVDKLSTCGGIGLPPKKGKNKSIGNGFIFSLKINPSERIYFGIQKVKLIFIADYPKNCRLVQNLHTTNWREKKIKLFNRL